MYLVLNLETGAKSFPTDSSQSSKTDNGVRQLTIPGYSDNGMLAWELKANEVNFESNGSYRAYDLILETMTGFNRSSANSKEGMFNPKHGKAWGDSQLAVNGNGFWAEGDQWLWENEIEDGNQLMAFQDNGRVLFAENLQLSKEGDGDKSPKLKNTPLETPKVEDRFKTKSQADYIEIIEISPTRNRFLLEGQVRVHSPSLQIECDWMEILFDKDTNQTKKLSLGKISLINARRNVKMVQGGENHLRINWWLIWKVERPVCKVLQRLRTSSMELPKEKKLFLRGVRGKRWSWEIKMRDQPCSYPKFQISVFL